MTAQPKPTAADVPFTPTDDEMRYVYARNDPDAADEFDRWLAEHDSQVRKPLVALLREVTDPDPCWFDHAGGCQAHGYLNLKPGETCPVYDAQQVIAAGEEP